jgi:hypothetical protein
MTHRVGPTFAETTAASELALERALEKNMAFPSLHDPSYGLSAEALEYARQQQVARMNAAICGKTSKPRISLRSSGLRLLHPGSFASVTAVWQVKMGRPADTS